MIDRNQVAAAAGRIAAYVRHTPVLQGDLGIDAPVTLKLELLQHTGSFKPRGAFNRLLTATLPPAGAIAASGGNHGAAVALCRPQPGRDRGNLRPHRTRRRLSSPASPVTAPA